LFTLPPKPPWSTQIAAAIKSYARIKPPPYLGNRVSGLFEFLDVLANSVLANICEGSHY
jgi:hypothetical protein